MGASSVARVRSSRSILSFGLLALPLAVVAVAACGGAPPPETPAPVAAPPPPPPPPAPEPVAEKPATAPAAPAAAPAPDLLKCTEMVEAPDGTIDDAEDGDDKTSIPGMWSVGADDKGSKVEEPKSPVTMAKGGADKSKMAFHAKGKTATGDGAWGVNMGPELGPAFDASKFAGISFWAKVGPKSTKTVRFNVMDVATVPQGNVCTQACWNHFGKEVAALDGNWKKITVAFSELTQQDGWGDPHPPHLDASKLYGLKWAVPAGQEFDIWIDQVKFLKCK